FPPMGSISGSPSDDEFDPDLDQTRWACRGDAAEIGPIAGVAIGLLELRVVPGIEHFDPELQSGRFPSAKRDEFLRADVPVVETGSVQNRAAAVAEVPYARYRKAGWVEPQKSVAPNIAGELAAVAITNTVGHRSAVQTTSGVWRCEINRLASRESDDTGEGPPAKSQVCGLRDVGPVGLSAAKRNLPDGAGYGSLTPVERRRALITTAAVRNLSIRQRAKLP